MALNSKTLFEAILDANDQAALGSTYTKWLLGLFSDEVRTSMFGSRQVLVCAKNVEVVVRVVM